MIDLMSIAKTEAQGGDLLAHISELLEPADKEVTCAGFAVTLKNGGSSFGHNISGA